MKTKTEKFKIINVYMSVEKFKNKYRIQSASTQWWDYGK